MKLPNSIDKTPYGKIVSAAQLGEQGYLENVNYYLTIVHVKNGIEINYQGEDGTLLSYPEIIYIINNFEL